MTAAHMQSTGYYYDPQNGYEQFPALQAVHEAVRGPATNPSSTGYAYGYGNVQQNAQQHPNTQYQPLQQPQQMTPLRYSQLPPQSQAQPQTQPQTQPQQQQVQYTPQQHTATGPQEGPRGNDGGQPGRSAGRTSQPGGTSQSQEQDQEKDAEGDQEDRQDAGQDGEKGSEQRTRGVQLNMPPVVGSMMHYANKHLKYRPFPPDVMAVRQKLFKMEEPFLLDSQQIADYWTHMSNVWMRSTRPSPERNGTVVEVWECRIRRRVERKGNKYHQRTGGNGVRNRPSKDNLLGDADACTPRIRVVSYTKHAENQKEPCTPGFLSCPCIPEWVYFERSIGTKNKDLKHTHDLDMCDRYKRTDAVMYCCKLKVEQHYNYPAVMRWMKEKFGHISTEVEYIQKQDVANVSRFWKQAHRGEEMRSQVVEETDMEKKRKDCLDAIDANPVERLRNALSEVCKRIPEAMDIAIPFLDMAQGNGEAPAEIASGERIKIPFPGLPHKAMKLFEPSGLRSAPEPSTPSSQPPFAGTSHPQGPMLPSTGTAIRPAYSQPPVATPQSAPGPTATSAIRSALPDVRNAHITDPESTHRAFIEASSAVPPSAPPPYATNNGKMPIQPLNRSRGSAQAWPPPSVTYPLAIGGTPRTGPAPAPFMQARPAWAQPVVPQKRGPDYSAEVARKATKPDGHERPSLTQEIASQLRKELAAA